MPKRFLDHTSRGLTLIEITVTLALSSILAYLVMSFLLKGSQLTARENGLLELEQSSHFLASKVEADLQNSGISGISYLASNSGSAEAVAMTPILDVTADGDLVWEDRIQAYAWRPDKQTLSRIEIKKSANILDNPIRLAPTDWAPLLSVDKSQSSVVAERMTFFSVRNRSTTNSSRLIDLALEISRDIPGLGTRKLRQERTIALRN